MRLVLLGAPRPLDRNRWKDCLAEGAADLGWSVLHLPARNIPADDVVRACRDADALLWARTRYHDPQPDPYGMLRRIEDLGVPTIALHLDLYWGLRLREAEIGQHPFWSCQWVFTADGGQRDWASRGVNHFWCPPPIGRRWLGRVAPAIRYNHQAVFVGSWVPRIHGPHRMGLIEWAARRWGSGFRRYGGRGGVWGAELSTLYSTAGVAVGDSARAPRYWSDRVPCSLGRGALLAHPHVEGMDEVGFTDEVMVRYEWGCYDQIGERLAALSGPQREAMRAAAVDLIAERHTWAHRLEEIFGVVFGAGDHRVRREPAQVGPPATVASAPGGP